MTALEDHWSGDDWQNYCRQLLTIRYGVAFQPVPDRDRGDLGIEGFTSSGEVFQCYAAQNPYNNEELYKKQRRKITQDLGKLVDNIENLKKLTGLSEIKCWVLLVPRFDSRRLIQHATSKTQEVLAKGLDIIHGEFYARVLTDQDFSSEKHTLEGTSEPLLPNPPSGATLEAVINWQVGRPEEAKRLNNKVATLSVNKPCEEQQELFIELIKLHLYGARSEEQLRQAQPQMWESLNQAKKHREVVLRAEHLAETSSERTTLQDEIHKMQLRLESVLPSLAGGQAETLAWGIVADWLIRCLFNPIPRAVA